MNRCIEANRPPGGLTVHLVDGHTVDLHIAGVTAGTLHWADGRRDEVTPSLPGTASGDGLGWSLDGDLTAQLRAAGVAYVQLVADDRVLMAGDVAWHSGWRGSCQPHQRVVYVSGPPGGPGIGIADVTAVDGVATITLTNGSTRTIDLPPGKDGHTPVVGLSGDRLTVDGVPVGGSLRGPAGHSPEVIVSGDVVTIDGQSTDPLTSTIPGPPTTLAVGEVATLPPSSPATAEIIGEPPSQTLTLGIPRGEVGPAGPPGADGNPTAYELRGTGSPNGAVTAPVGTYYTDTISTNGATRWYKKTGTGNTGWVVVFGDTGWRNITGLQGAGATGEVSVCRVADSVWIRCNDYKSTQTLAKIQLPAGFGVAAKYMGAFYGYNGSSWGYVWRIDMEGVYSPRHSMLFPESTGNLWLRHQSTYSTTDPWPTTLPGSPS